MDYYSFTDLGRDGRLSRSGWKGKKVVRTVGTLTSQAEIGVWVQAPAALLRRPGVLLPGNF